MYRLSGGGICEHQSLDNSPSSDMNEFQVYTQHEVSLAGYRASISVS